MSQSTGQFRAHHQSTSQDWAALSAWVARQGHTLETSGARQFAGGKANLNYLVVLDGQPAVFRRPPAGPIAEGANDMAREWRVLSRLGDGFALAPRGLLYCDDPDVLAAPSSSWSTARGWQSAESYRRGCPSMRRRASRRLSSRP
ncbi:phosphotransferase enzyme family protein [Mycobacteroides abscessus subsp. bolletii 1513]|uniref:Phosphotransferase enzyme family protein n=1 Tax=Mycobacteroides abscessus subsp. bolletii 1513 TaxID=1299321 RepID=X8DZ24_9MYCO|nr:phosphotransferase enzyme family protein [Mycobacteroides abscessus subsp. bolletii 1513]